MTRLTLPLAVRSRWEALSPPERRALRWALVVLVCALAWWGALAPALRILRAAPQQYEELEAQWQQMRVAQAQVQALQARPRISVEEARKAIALAAATLGTSAQVIEQGEQTVVRYRDVPGDVLARWLATVRQNARALPTEAHWKRNAAGTWEGTIVLTMGGPP
ncbi:type II secretion system protein GspM [Candidatus Symbiobacter mobilis]|uniref:General secretion pathway protein M n=1 Tax=Candidatus Symbiobacter mobilis CR TaxID=946483 RepID=U5N882_9BURK|nr:type II secretion system protein GspM [Candidatus Symbiobacter mobilis]AGX87771.1 hypothetical protein Cenrod_1686 [Candidatus Symbiobacter mobilis CR]